MLIVAPCAAQYVVFKDILDSTEVETALDKLWVEIESRSEAVSRSDPSTWDNGWQTNGWGHDDFLWCTCTAAPFPGFLP